MYVTISGKMCTNKCNFAFQAEQLNPWMQRPQTPFQGSGARLHTTENSMFISFPQFIYCSHDEVYFPKLSCLIAARRYLAFQMGTIQRLLCIKFMTSQSHLWRYCCIVISRGPWLLRRCFKRGFGDHRKQPIYEFNWISIEIQLIKLQIEWLK